MLWRAASERAARLCRPRMPDDNERDFLGALLLDPPAAHLAWARWLRRADMPAGGSDLAPMLGARLPQLEPVPPPDLRARLHAAVMVEQRRGARIAEILAHCQTRFAAAALPALLIDGPVPSASDGLLALRHSARLAFLLPAATDGRRAAAALLESGLAVPVPAARLPGRHVLRHQSGLPIHLHAERLPPPFGAFSFARLSEALSADGDLRAADRLALALADGMRSGAGGRDLRWIADVALLLRSADRQRLNLWLTMDPIGSFLSAAFAVVGRVVPGLCIPVPPPAATPRTLLTAVRLRGRRAVLAALLRA